MQFSWGSYVHSVANRNPVWFSEHRDEALSQLRQRTHYNVTWTITGYIARNSQAELTAALGELVAAYSQNNLDAVWLDNQGAETAHALRSSDTLNGVRVVRRQWLPGGSTGGPVGPRTEYVNIRSYRIVLQAEILSYEHVVVSFYQSIHQRGGGGADFVVQEHLNGPPVRQDTVPSTKFVVIQSGYAEGLLEYPNFPASIWPGSYRDRLSDAMKMTPRRWGLRRNTIFPIRWSYHHESAEFLSIVPPPIFV